MESIRINTEGVRLCINDDETRVITFNPTDVSFAERFYDLIAAFENREKGYKVKAELLQKDTSVDKLGIPKNAKEQLNLLKETCEFVRSEIDKVFGAGTSKAAFGDANTLDMFEQFFVGITPFVQKSREEKVKKYTGTKKRGVLK